MGRITIFTSTHCLFSLQIKHELTKRKLPFSEVNLSEYPEKLADCMANQGLWSGMSNRNSSPGRIVWVDNTSTSHIGGGCRIDFDVAVG